VVEVFPFASISSTIKKTTPSLGFDPLFFFSFLLPLHNSVLVLLRARRLLLGFVHSKEEAVEQSRRQRRKKG
jgi:hypothetical protein